jgi:hypothetical protein
MSIFGAGAGGVTAGAESRFGEGNSTTAAFANGAISFAGALAGELIGRLIATRFASTFSKADTSPG